MDTSYEIENDVFRVFGVMGFVYQHCGCTAYLRAVATDPPAKRRLGAELLSIGFTIPP